MKYFTENIIYNIVST